MGDVSAITAIQTQVDNVLLVSKYVITDKIRKTTKGLNQTRPL